MGLLDGLLLLPLAPVRGVAWLSEHLAEMAYQEETDPAMIRWQLAEIEEAHEAGALSDEEAEELEEPWLRLLLDIEGGSSLRGDVIGAQR
jgi:Gas vesicle protein G